MKCCTHRPQHWVYHSRLLGLEGQQRLLAMGIASSTGVTCLMGVSHPRMCYMVRFLNQRRDNEAITTRPCSCPPMSHVITC